MKGIVYIHYGSTVFDSSKGFPIRNEAKLLLILKNVLDKVMTLSSFVGMGTNIVSKKLMTCISVCMDGIAILSSFLIR